MSKRSLSAEAISALQIPEKCTRIVVTQNNSRITIRNSQVATSSIENKQSLLIAKLTAFYSVHEHVEQIRPVLAQDASVSLRLIDWLVTNYSKKRNVTLAVTRGGSTENINLFLDYKAHLKSYSKRSFDPFCRRERILMTFPTDPQQHKYITTAAQLNFFKWAIDSNVLSYCRENAADIEQDMVANVRVRVEPTGRRREISQSATSTLSRRTCSGAPERVMVHTD